MPEFLTLSTEDRITTVTFTRPQALNALNRSVLHELALFLHQTKDNPDVGGIIVTGDGEKAFVAGADIAEIAACNGEKAWELARNGQDVFRTLELFPKPVVAAVNGYALGGGCELAMACHIRLASTGAKFGLPEVGLGLIPGWGGTQRLSRLVGTGRALELILSGKVIGAGEALQMGLVNAVHEPAGLLSAAMEMLKTILSKAPLSLTAALEAVYKGQDQPLDEGMETEAECFSRLFETEDMREGCKAFLEKRKAVFSGK